jgi:hypothetical protein
MNKYYVVYEEKDGVLKGGGVFYGDKLDEESLDKIKKAMAEEINKNGIRCSEKDIFLSNIIKLDS